MKEKIIILGIAQCLEQDLGEICFGRAEDFDFLAVGLDCSDRVLFDIQHAASYHPEEFPEFYARRKKIGGNLDYKTHSHETGKGRKGEVIFTPDYIWPLIDRHPFSGSSSFLGAQASIALGYKKIILCGCPMSGPNILAPKKSAYDTFQKGWIKHVDKLEGKVRSVSGWTKDFLGYPSKEWLETI